MKEKKRVSNLVILSYHIRATIFQAFGCNHKNVDVSN